MDKNQTIQKFNVVANTFSVLGKSIEKNLSVESKETTNNVVCHLADMLIDEINELKNSFGCEVK